MSNHSFNLVANDCPPVIFQMRDADAETFQCPEALIVEIQRAVIQTEN